MKPGFALAGLTIAERRQRARTVRPNEENTHRLLQPISDEMLGDLEGDKGKSGDGGEQESMEQLDQKYQQLKNQIEEYFDDEHGK